MSFFAISFYRNIVSENIVSDVGLTSTQRSKIIAKRSFCSNDKKNRFPSGLKVEQLSKCIGKRIREGRGCYRLSVLIILF